MRNKKGQFIKGALFPLEFREKMSKGAKEKGNGKWMKGRKLSEEICKKMSIAKRNMSEETKKKMGKSREGENNPSWKGGITTYGRKLFLNLRRRARKLSAEGSHTFREWELLKKQYGFICLSCRKKEPDIKLTEDHINPLIKGGSDFIDNIQPLCINCNCKKHTKIINYV